MDKFKNISTKVLLAITFVVIFYFYIFLEKNSFSGHLQINFLDVGQGDSILIETPQGKHILIDAGDSGTIVSQVAEILPIQKKNFDLAILTHPHFDHIGGFNYLSEYYIFDKVLQLPIEYTSQAYLSWLNYLSENNVDVSAVYSGDTIKVESDLVLRIMWPQGQENLGDLSLNDTSIVFMLEYKDFKVLFMGDAEEMVEEYLLDNNTDLSANILKAGHHGSKTSTTEAFLQNVNPDIAIISVGENNKFGHPSNETISKLNDNEVKIYRTDRNGTVQVISDGESFWVEE